MPGISRKTTDSAGGVISGGSSNAFVNSKGAVRHGDTVTPHGIDAHATNPTMIASQNSKVFINNKLAVVAGDLATCGHASTGSTNVFVG